MQEEKKLNIKKTFKNPIFWLVIGLLIIVGVYFFIFNGQVTREAKNDFALKINDEVYSFDDYDRAINQIRQQYMMQGMNLPDEQLREMATQSLIQQALLKDLLEKKDIEVSSQELEARLQEIIVMSGVSEEEFFDQLKSEGLENREEIDEILMFEIRLDKYFKELAQDIDVSDEEVQDSYDKFIAQVEALGEDEQIPSEEIPEFEEVKNEIRDGLIEEKIMPIIIALLEDMEKDAIIKSNLEEVELEASLPEIQMLDPEDLDLDFEELE